MINLITDQKPWTRNQIRKRAELFIQQEQVHGDETMLARVNDAELLGLRPLTDGERAFRNEQYLPRAIAGGDLAAQMKTGNEKLIVAIAHQDALRLFSKANALLNGENSLSETVQSLDDEGGEITIPSPAYSAAVALFDESLSELTAMTAEDFRLLAQRSSGAVIDDELELNLAVIRMLPTDDLLKAYVEGEGLGSVDRRKSLEDEKARLLLELDPPEIVVVFDETV